MNQEDREFIEDLGRWFYGHPPSVVNASVGEVLARMLVSVREKSSALDWIPRPPGSVPGVVWLLSQAVQLAWRANHGGSYQMAVNAVALQYRTEYTLAQYN